MTIEGNLEEALKYYAALPYTIIIEPWNDGNEVYYVARVVELPHCIIHGDTPEEAVKEIEEVKMDWIRSNLKRGLKIPEPVNRKYSGQIRLRISPTIHRLLSYRAEIEHVSLNQLMSSTLAQAVGYPASSPKENSTQGTSKRYNSRKASGLSQKYVVKA
jgi:antitoxin HicB